MRGVVFFIEAETTLLFHVRGDLGEGSMINIVKRVVRVVFSSARRIE